MLEKQEQIESYQVAHNGRLRKYFHLTPIGAAAIEQFLNEWTQVTAIYEYIKGEA